MIKAIKQIPIVAFAILLIGISVNMFLGPHGIAAGGVSGIGILVEKVSDIDRAVTVMVLNAFMLVLTLIFLGMKVFTKTLIGSILLPVSLAIVPEIMVADDKLLSVIVGSTIFAIGVAILYKIESSSGGTTIPPLIFKKYFNLNTSVGLLFTDAIIVIFNIFFFDTEAFLFAIVSLIITSIVMTYLETGVKRRKAVMIMSAHHMQEIKEKLYEDKDNGLTIFNVSNDASGTKRDMVMVIVENSKYPRLMNVVDTIDKNSFVIAYNVSEVHGLGITYEPYV